MERERFGSPLLSPLLYERLTLGRRRASRYHRATFAIKVNNPNPPCLSHTIHLIVNDTNLYAVQPGHILLLGGSRQIQRLYNSSIDPPAITGGLIKMYHNGKIVF